MVDVVREEHQNREDFLARYLTDMRERWTRIPPDQLETACAHVAAYDHPECLSALQQIAKASGLNNNLLVSRYGQHHVILFSRNDPSDIKTA